MGARTVVGATNLNGAVPSGFNRFTGELLRAMLSLDPDLLVLASDPDWVERHRGSARLVRWRVMGRSGFAGNAARLAWNQLQLPSLLRSQGAELFYSPVPEGMLSPPCPQVVTVHDVVPLLFPESHPRLRYYYQHLLPRVMSASSAIVTVSEATRRDLRRMWGLSDHAIHVVYQGFRDDLFMPAPEGERERVRARYGLGSYLLAVGDTRPHKNLQGAIRAFAALRPVGVELAVVGRAAVDDEIAALLRALGVAERVRFLGPVGDEDLVALYSGARALVFPSIYEGFGIPPLEAMACGCPVVASDAASLPEVCGDAVVYVDPHDPESIATGIAEVLADGAREALAHRGLERAATFRYRCTAEQVLRVLEEERTRRRPSPARTGRS